MPDISHHQLRIPGATESGKHDRTLYGGMLLLDDELPVVICNDRQLSDITAEALSHLKGMDKGRSIFVRAGRPVYVCYDERNRAGIHDFNAAAMRGRLARAARFYNLTASGPVSCAPPSDMVQDLLALTPKALDLPRLEGIIEAPALRPDGTIICDPGYDPDTGLFFAPSPGLALPEIPDRPSRDEIFRAFALIWEIIEEFPFNDDSSATNALAALLTPVVRPAILGPIPLALFTAPTPGTGKTMLADIISLVVCGHGAALFSAPHTGEEWRKALTAVLREASPLVVIDNVSLPLDSAELCKALTADQWGDRILGHSRTVRLPVRPTWIATGNNIRVAGDMPRRCYWIQLDAKVSEPWMRTGFRYADLRAHVLQQRGELLAALLTLARAWYTAGCPPPRVQPMGSFESWVRVVGGTLEHTGMRGFLANRVDQIDEEAEEWEGFLLALRLRFGSSAFSSARIYRECADASSPLHDAMPELTAEFAERDGSFQRHLGQAFRDRVGRRFGKSQVHIERAGRRHGAALWCVRMGNE